jgi:hypothetical protein
MSKLCYFENALGYKIGGSGFHGSDQNPSQDFHCIWLGFSDSWEGLYPATYIYVGHGRL